MDSSDSEDGGEDLGKKLNHAKYAKILPDGTVDSSRLGDEDYALVKQFVQTAFPETSQVQRELEQTLKRTFVLGRGSQTLDRSFRTPNPKPKGTRLSKTKMRTLGILKEKKVPRLLAYQDFVEVNSLWTAYVADLCKFDKDSAEIQGKLNKMDLHGSHLTVIQSNCSSYENLEGIVVKETRNTFVVVTKENLPKTIPKADTVFDVRLDNPAGLMRIAGNSFLTRPAERVSKKIKSFVDFIGLKQYKSKLKFSELPDGSN